MTMFATGALEHPSRGDWEGETCNGALLMTIAGGHMIDYIAYCFGPLAEASASVETQVRQWHFVDTGETVDVEAADNVLINAVLASGGLLSFHVAAVPFHATGRRMEVYGSKGTIIATTQLLPQISSTSAWRRRSVQPEASTPTLTTR